MNYRNKYQIAKEDLEWLFNFSEADSGIKSNWQAMINVSCFGASSDFQDPYNTFSLNCARRSAELQSILRQLPSQSQEILFATFGPAIFPRHIQKMFAQLSGAAFISANLTQAKFDALCSRIQSNTATPKDKVQITEIRINANTIHTQAIDQYISARTSFFKNKKDI